LTVSETIELLNSSHQGLTREEVKRRFTQFGPNEPVEKQKTPAWALPNDVE
jgi:magnesium-transporting ATPase (P-type)